MIFEIEKLHLKDVMAASQLIGRAFSSTAAQTLTNEGVSTFRSIMTVDSIEQRLAFGSSFIVCKNKLSIVGVAEIRDRNHLNLLFVEPSLQRKGIGRTLLLKLVDGIKVSEITVNSSLHSVGAYASLFSKLRSGSRSFLQTSGKNHKFTLMLFMDLREEPWVRNN